MLPHGEHVLTAAEQGIFVEVKTPTCRGWIKKELLSSSRPPCQKSLEQIYVESGLSPSEAAEKAAQFRKHEADMEERAQQTKLLKEQEKQREEKAAQEKAKKEAKRKKEKEIDAMFEEMENGGSRSTPRCKTGIPCGNSCISAKKKCHK